jgi:putative SOS response-associated peptidase YedK
MCGRFALVTPPARLARYFQAVLDDRDEDEPPPSWNVAPTDPVVGVRVRRAKETGTLSRVLTPYRWGLIPSWAKDPAAGNRLFNARAETVATKASFRTAFAKHRILVPADGFYEWHKLDDGIRQPYYFTRTDGAPLAFAGLAEWWRDPEAPRDAPGIRSCTIITTAAGHDMDGIHDRMPVVLSPDTFDVWLDPDNDENPELTSLLRAAPDGTLTHHPVSRRVGNVRNNDASLVAPVPDPGAPAPSLFDNVGTVATVDTVGNEDQAGHPARPA